MRSLLRSSQVQVLRLGNGVRANRNSTFAASQRRPANVGQDRRAVAGHGSLVFDAVRNLFSECKETLEIICRWILG
jgi:hypothetical protein